MKKLRPTTGKAIIAFVLVLILVGSFYLPGSKSFAAGSITGTVTKEDGWAGKTVVFNLYKVGDYGRDPATGKVIYVLDKEVYEGSGVKPVLEDPDNYGKDQTDAAWTKMWLSTANTLSKYINSQVADEDKPPLAKTADVTFADDADTAVFTMTGLDNGLYLLIGSSFEVGNTLWTPQPMFVSVLNGERKITFGNSDLAVKMISRNIVHEHSILKVFEGDEVIKEYIQPEKIAVDIMYGNNRDAVKVDTVILDKNSNPEFSYSWKDKIHYRSGDDASDPDDDEIISIEYIVSENGEDKVKSTFEPVVKDSDWFVVELRGKAAREAFTKAGIDSDAADKYVKELEYYTVEYGTTPVSDTHERLDITNTYTYKKLVLTKKIDAFYEDADDAAFSFLIEGFDQAEQKGNKIYENHLGVVINQNDDSYEKTVELKYIPSNVQSIRITEEYTGNYENVKLEWEEKTPSSDAEDQTIYWEAIAENTHTGHTPNGGVVNKYRHDQEDSSKPEQDGPSREAKR